MDPAADTFRVTIKNLRGDVASCASHDFINALEGAIKMAGARADRMELAVREVAQALFEAVLPC
jgi:hypothetical protein